jgi:hypothetical protein
MARLSKADGEDKDPQAYRAASRPYADRALLLKRHDKNPSLCLFVEQVEAIRIQ